MSEGPAGGIMHEYTASVTWNKAHGFYPSDFVWPWYADGSAVNDKDYGTSFPPALVPTSNSHWKVFDWTKPYPGITVAP